MSDRQCARRHDGARKAGSVIGGSMSDDQNHGSHRHGASSERARYVDFVDEMFRLGAIGKERRDVLRRGLETAFGGGSARPIVPPSSSHIKSSDAGIVRAVKAGLVSSDGPGRHTVKAGAETVHWGYLWGAAEPILRVKSGDVVTVDTVSHEGLLSDQGPPEAFFE